MSEQIITKDELKRLIKNESIRPEDLFEGEELAQYRKRIEAELALERERTAAKPDPDKYTNPAKNSFIKTNPDF
jgi:hypothetical protein